MFARRRLGLTHRGQASGFAIASLIAVGLAACGNSRTPVPNQAQLDSPLVFHRVRLPDAGIIVRAPLTWGIAADRRPLVNTISSGDAVVAIWRYPRQAPVKLDPVAVRRVGQRLIATARAKDPRFRLLATRVVRVGGAPTVEIDALEQVGQGTRRVRSLHVYTPGAELVLDEYAPPASFASIDASVFSPLTQSVVLRPLRTS
jgi:hypothetical protein